MVGMGVRVQALEAAKLVPDGGVVDRLDASGFRLSWLVGDWELLVSQLNGFDGVRFVLVIVLE